MEKYIDLKEDSFESVHVAIKETTLHGERVLRVVKSEKIMEFDENTYAKLLNSNFNNGILEVKMLSRLLPDAPDFARGFIGIAYRISDDDSKFESFYVRPTNGMTEDPVRKARGCQYFSYPNYTFAYFRDNNITKYEAPAAIGLDEWITLRAVIHGESAEFYINNDKTPTLIVTDMKHGANQSGKIGFFVDIGTEAFFKDLKITI
jgi:hypothetical protein